jgi:peroxisomal 3,2-trans-enoyl-CoA isomerase
MQETISAIRELNEHPDTIFTVLTGEGRFFSAGADVRGASLLSWKRWNGDGRADHVKYVASSLDTSEDYATKAEKKIAYLTRFAPGASSLPFNPISSSADVSSQPLKCFAP